MTDGTDIACAALQQAQSKWSTYFTLLGGVILAFTIDYFNGWHFWRGDASIKALGLNLSRTTFSITYMLVFSVIVLRQVSSARIVRTLCEELADPESRAVVARSAEVRLWALSPLNANAAVRAIFWSLAATGLVMLSVASVIHLSMSYVPVGDQVSDDKYFRIGIYCATTLTVSLWLAVTRIYPDWERTRAILGSHASPDG